MGNDLALKSAPVITRATMLTLRNFLEASAKTYKIDVIQIDLHGGEPLMLKKERMELLCAMLHDGNYNGASLRIAIQTNATLIDEEWIKIFQKYQISVSVSIDGPKHINDINRLDHQGRSSYERTLNGYKMLTTRSSDGSKEKTAPVLSVINPQASGKTLFRHLYDAMGCRQFDFLLPDCNYANPTDIDGMSRFLVDLCDEWYNQNDPKCHVRIINAHIAQMAGNENTFVLGVTTVKDSAAALAFTVTSEGDIYIDDTLRSTNSDIFTSIGNITDTSLKEIIASKQLNTLSTIEKSLPDECRECVWRNICCGGRPINRYSPTEGFKRKTIYCDSMKTFFSRCASILHDMGVGIDEIAKNIGVENDA